MKYLLVMGLQKSTFHVLSIAKSAIESRFSFVLVPHVPGKSIFGSTFVFTKLTSNRLDFFMNSFDVLLHKSTFRKSIATNFAFVWSNLKEISVMI